MDMKTMFLVIVVAWLLFGLASNILLRKEKMPFLFRLLLLVEGLLGLVFALVMKQGRRK